jgi:hypothetical protein
MSSDPKTLPRTVGIGLWMPDSLLASSSVTGVKRDGPQRYGGRITDGVMLPDELGVRSWTPARVRVHDSGQAVQIRHV